MHLIKKLGFFSAFILVAVYTLGYYFGNYGNFFTVALAFVIIPLVDTMVGKDSHNIPRQEMSNVAKEFYYRFILYLWVYAQLAVVVFGAYAVSLGEINTPLSWIGFTLSTAIITGGIGITVAHELGHKKSKLEQLYSKVLLMTVCYMHFFIEHNRGHHVRVATPEDPATSRKNETFYRFWFRSVFKGYTSAWNLEANSRKRKGLNPIGLRNTMIWYLLIPILFCTVLTIVFSYMKGVIAWEVPIFFFGQSILAFTLLEQVNYIEHYGIVRKKNEDGRYERVTQLHSWNANHLISNFFLFQLQRHSDHHMNAIKRYQVLDHFDESPQLPFGYSTMVVMALFPSLWFKYMNPRLENWERSVYNK